jgi:hypothetical protein
VLLFANVWLALEDFAGVLLQTPLPPGISLERSPRMAATRPVSSIPASRWLGDRPISVMAASIACASCAPVDIAAERVQRTPADERF